MKKWLMAIIGVLCIALYVFFKQVQYSEAKWKTAMANMKAYSTELSAVKNKNTAYQMTISQLESYKDSVFMELDKTRKELKIKDKNLKALQQLSSNFTKTDTLILKDTIFKEPSLNIDTVFGDKWYSTKLTLKYPATVVVKPSFQSDKHIVVSTKKETVNPPKKFFLFRWFQRKHYVLNVNVIEKNPYVENANSRYIEIIK